jgi:serine protease Do
MAKNIYEQLKTGKKVERGFLGVATQDMDADYAKAFGLKDNNGVLIPNVIKDSAADKAGIKHNDVILELDGKPVTSANELRNRIAMLSPGAKVIIKLWRDGKEKTVTVELGNLDTQAGTESAATVDSLNEIGFTVQNLTDEQAKRYGYDGDQGVLIISVQPGSQADRVGLTPGMLIKEVNRREVANTKEFNQAIEDAKKSGTALLLVKQDAYSIFVLLTLSK